MFGIESGPKNNYIVIGRETISTILSKDSLRVFHVIGDFQRYMNRISSRQQKIALNHIM